MQDARVATLLPSDGPAPAPVPERVTTMTITMTEGPDGGTEDIRVQGPRDAGIAGRMLFLANLVVTKRALQDANLIRGDGLVQAVGDGG